MTLMMMLVLVLVIPSLVMATGVPRPRSASVSSVSSVSSQAQAGRTPRIRFGSINVVNGASERYLGTWTNEFWTKRGLRVQNFQNSAEQAYIG